MRRQGKNATTSVAGPSQPSLHHMWSTRDKSFSMDVEDAVGNNEDHSTSADAESAPDSSSQTENTLAKVPPPLNGQRTQKLKNTSLRDNTRSERASRKSAKNVNEKKKPAHIAIQSQPRLFPLFEKREQTGTGAISTLNSEKDYSEESSRKIKRLKRTISVPHASQRNSVTDESYGGSLSQPLPAFSLKNTRIIDKEAPANLQSPRSGSRDEPIVLEASPERDLINTSAVHLSSSVEHRQLLPDQNPGNFFSSRKLNSAKTKSRSRRKVGEGDLAPWPGTDALHVRDLFKVFRTSLLEFKRVPARLHLENPTPPYESPKHLLTPRSQPSTSSRVLVEPVGNQPDDYLKRENTLSECATHPAITRFLSADYDITGTSWNERWRPQNASEVIGNEGSALYLRDWLLALEIKADIPPTQLSAEQSNGINSLKRDTRKTTNELKRPKIIREVNKPRKRRKANSDDESLDNWIASDDDDEEQIFPPTTFLAGEEDIESELSEPGSPWKPKLTRLSRSRPPDSEESKTHKGIPTLPPPIHDFSDRLTNTILLSGPSGSGKSAAVYACAEELGWEVFEVYPGIGKRNGTSILSLVGDVGKNHIVNRASRSLPLNLVHDSGDGLKGPDDTRPPKQKGLLSCFSIKSKTPQWNPPLNVKNQSTRDDILFPTHLLDRDVQSSRQSIILLEEVDILYNEDVNFWPTVITLIRESRRPVVMTCNDPNLVPSALLPLQTTLIFKPCPEDLALTYLKCLTLIEGYSVKDDHLRGIYEGELLMDAQDVSDNLVRSNPRFLPYIPDLRRAINQLQFLCQGDPGYTSPEPTTGAKESTFHVFNPSTLEDESFAPDDLSSWDWATLEGRDSDVNPGDAIQFNRLCLLSDTLSNIDSDLSRSPSDFLKMYVSDETCPSDDELGHLKLDCRTEDCHLQNGTNYYDYDEQIANEARYYAGRVVRSAGSLGTANVHSNFVRTGERGSLLRKLNYDRSQRFALVSGVLERVLPMVARESKDVLILDFEPWVRSIDRSDGIMEAATISEHQTRAATRGGRTTRNSQRVQYERYLCLDEETRQEWEESGLKITDDLLR